MFLALLKRAAGYGETDVIPDEEFAVVMHEAFPVPAEPPKPEFKTIVDWMAAKAEDSLDVCREDKARLEEAIEANEAANVVLRKRLAETEFVMAQLEPLHERLALGLEFVERGEAGRAKRGKPTLQAAE